MFDSTFVDAFSGTPPEVRQVARLTSTGQRKRACRRLAALLVMLASCTASESSIGVQGEPQPVASDATISSPSINFASDLIYQCFGPAGFLRDPNLIAINVCDFDCCSTDGPDPQNKASAGGNIISILLTSSEMPIDAGDYDVAVGQIELDYHTSKPGRAAVAYYGSYSDWKQGYADKAVTEGSIRVNSISLTGPQEAPTAGSLSGSFTLTVPANAHFSAPHALNPNFVSFIRWEAPG